MVQSHVQGTLDFFKPETTWEGEKTRRICYVTAKKAPVDRDRIT